MTKWPGSWDARDRPEYTHRKDYSGDLKSTYSFYGAVNDAGSSADHVMSKPMCTWQDIRMSTKNRV